MRKRPHPQHENHERWLVSYADFITLLFAFFVVMFASTQQNKAKAVSESVREALNQGKSSSSTTVLGQGKHQVEKVPENPDPAHSRQAPPPSKLPPPKQAQQPEQPAQPPAQGSQPAAQSAAQQAVPPGSQPHQQPGDLAKSLTQLQQGLALELKSGKVQVKLEARGLIISLREAAFFASADDAIAPASMPTLEKIAVVIRDLPNSVRLEGHTDSIPIHNSRFRSNWDLSSARAIAMLQLLRDRFQVPPARMSVGGYAENAPADTNDTVEGRAHNRRVDVVILSPEGMKSEPK